MAAKLIKATDPIEIKQIGCLVYGQPGSRKTSLAQTAENPITLAFDPGLYRAQGRKDAFLFETWEDVMSCNLAGYKTVVIDTVAMGMEKLAQLLMAESAKNGNRSGGLSLQGYGQLATRFAAWVSILKQHGQDLVMVCHEDAEKREDGYYFSPAFVGQKFYSVAMQHADIVGYMHFENGKRCIDFTPTDRWMAKAPPCGWKTKELPDFADSPTYLADLISEAKASMGKISQASAGVASVVAEWEHWLSEDPTIEQLNERIPEIGKLAGAAKTQAWGIVKAFADKTGLTFDAKAKTFSRGTA